MSSTPFICCSSGVATDCSMVSASAPGYCAVTVICGGTIWGNCATGRPRSATIPPRTVTMAMTIATIGRRMKKRDMSVALRRLRVDGGPVAHRRRVDDHSLARLQAGFDDPAVADTRAELHTANGHLVVAVGNPQLEAALQLRDGALRDEQDLLANGGLRLDAAVLPGAQDVAG